MITEAVSFLLAISFTIVGLQKLNNRRLTAEQEIEKRYEKIIGDYKWTK